MNDNKQNQTSSFFRRMDLILQEIRETPHVYVRTAIFSQEQHINNLIKRKPKSKTITYYPYRTQLYGIG